MFLSEDIKMAGKLGEGKNSAEPSGGENGTTKEGQKAPLVAKKRRKNRKNKKGPQKLEVVNGEPAGGGGDKDAEKTSNGTPHLASDATGEVQKSRKKRKQKKAKQVEPADKNNTPMPAQGEKTEGEMTAASTEGTVEVTAANNAGSKRKRKKKNKKKKADQAGGTSQDTVEEEGHPAKKMKIDNVEQEKEKEKEVSAAETPTENNKPRLSKAQKRKERKRKIKQAIEALNKNKVATQDQNTSPTTTTITGNPGIQDKENGKKRKLNDADESSVSVTDSKQSNNAKNEEVPSKKIKPESAEENPDSQKEATSGPDNEGPAKKKKRKRRKKKRNLASDSTDAGNMDNKDKEKEEKENIPDKKLKEETTEDTPNKEEAKPETATPKKKKRRRRNKDRKKSEGNESSPLNTSGCKTSNTDTSQAQLQATTALTNSKQGSDTQMPVLHQSCISKENKMQLAKCWKDENKEGLVIEKGSIEVIKNPFTCCYIPHLVQDEAYLDGVKKELENVELLTKNNDLYKFKQTGDLKGVTSPFIAGLRHLLYTDVRQWLIGVTGIPLSDVVDMGSSRYSHTDVLLCHDDQLEGRRIAYILYLVPPWGSEDGGSLDLFATDGDGHPSDIVKSLIPKNNAFAFFEVSPVSFHQVSEVLSRNKTRLSINGWFHGPLVPRPKRNPPPPNPLQGPTHMEEEDFYAWINPMYFDMNIQKEIRQKFCAESELELENFLTDEAYEKLSKTLKGEGLTWQHTGPADRQHYEILAPDSMPQDIKECHKFLSCEALFLILSQLTGLKLHPLAPQDSDEEEEEGEKSSAEPNPRCHVEAQRWGPGSYTLIRDDCVDSRAALDAFLYANVSKKWKQELGGHVTYIAKDEDEELLTVVPQSNCLCLVYRDAQTLRFTKYITSTAKDLGAEDSHFHNFACTYYE